MAAKSRALLSRSGITHPLGKLEDRLDIPVPAVLKEKISAVAMVNGKNAAEWARDALEKLVEGELAFMRRRVNGDGVRGDGTNV